MALREGKSTSSAQIPRYERTLQADDGPSCRSQLCRYSAQKQALCWLGRLCHPLQPVMASEGQLLLERGSSLWTHGRKSRQTGRDLVAARVSSIGNPIKVTNATKPLSVPPPWLYGLQALSQMPLDPLTQKARRTLLCYQHRQEWQ